MRIRSAIATVVGCTLLGAAVGAGIGYGVGTLAPEYYRTVFRRGREPGFDPVSVGVAAGLTQGTAGGVVVGLAVVALLSWRKVRRRPAEEQPAPADDEPAGAGVPARQVLFLAGAVLGMGLCLGSGLVVGLLRGEQDAYHRRFLEEQAAIAPLLAGDPAFAGVEL